ENCTYTLKSGALNISSNQILHPARESLTTIKRINFELGPPNFNAQYLQRPITLNHGMISREWFEIADDNLWSDKMDITMSIDTAQQVGSNNDYTVVQFWGFYNNKFFLMDQWRGRWFFTQLCQICYALVRNMRPRNVLIEAQAAGFALADELRQIKNIKVVTVNSRVDKVSRLAKVSGVIAAKRVVLPKTKKWINQLINEVINFPRVKNDDQVDAMSQYLEFMRNNQNVFCGPDLVRL
ncbi:MAG: phage terminase large subunit, partial [Pseudomonadota bacterium]